jgi:hypothetical protein
VNLVVVSGAIANKPFNGGATWTRLSYLLGLQRLGFDTYFVEQIEPEICVDQTGHPTAFYDSENVSYFRRITEQFGLQNRASLINSVTRQTEGLSYHDLLALADSAVLLVNISGHLSVEMLKSRFRRKVYIDLDPGFTQFWYAKGTTAGRLAGHDCYFTVGENIGKSECLVPAGDIPWRPVRQPVVIDLWPACTTAEPNRFTTVASWRGPYGPVEYGGKTYGLKVHQFRKYMALPMQIEATFEVALDIHAADHKDRDLLLQHSWRLIDPRRAAGDPFAFRNYVQGSGAEFSAAQQIYVETRNGWFSDRTVRYLASGKPVIVEDTGFSANYPCGQGLIPFSSLKEARAGVEDVRRNHATHAGAARQIAEQYFDSNRVLAKMVDEIGI